MPDKSKRALVELLAWYREMGIDAAVSEPAIDWLQRGETPPGEAALKTLRQAKSELPAQNGQPANQDHAPTGPEPGRLPYQQDDRRAQTTTGGSQRHFPTEPPDASVKSARQLAAAARTIDELASSIATFDGCSLKATAKNTCVFRGAPKARIMIIGEAPGRDEDLTGKPFVGRAGMLLDKMLAAIDLDESAVHITNVVYWRPPGNRTPTPQETLICRPFLERQTALVEPEVILLLGGAAAKHILQTTDGIMRLRGKWRDCTIGTRTFRALATLHPAYLLRTPGAKRLAWRDLLEIRAALGQ